MNAYIVAGLFSDGALCINGIVAAAPEVATAITVAEYVRTSKSEATLTAVIAAPLAVEFLRAALQALEGDKSGGVVLALVPKAD